MVTATADYPLLLQPHLAERVWGGSLLGEGIGEAWDLSAHPHGLSTIANGPLTGKTLAQVDSASFGGPIALLAKRLDCRQDLSIQVHPRTGDPKTEAWVVLEADTGAGVYHGFEGGIGADTLRSAAQDGSLPKRMRFLQVQPGQCVFVPSGTVHAIGGGLLLFELQQSADTTYRLFDWGRGRDLHLEDGVACSDLGESEDAIPKPQPRDDGSLRLVQCEHFFIDRIDVRKPYALDPGGAWIAVLMISGRARVGALELETGRTLMVPRAAGTISLEPDPACSAIVYGP